jgi:hypothetical protein
MVTIITFFTMMTMITLISLGDWGIPSHADKSDVTEKFAKIKG